MSTGTITITQLDDPIDYCRVYDGSSFTDRDVAAVDYDATTGFELWTDSNDYVYVGKDTTFAYVGFSIETVPVGYGTFTLEYWNGSTWDTLNAKIDNTAFFTQDGYLGWSIPGDWATTSVDGQTAYWIRAKQSAVSPSTPATCYHLLRNVTLNPPIKVIPERTFGDIYRDINGTVRKRDVEYKGIMQLTVECRLLAVSMANLNLLQDWRYYYNRLWIEDNASSTPLDFRADAYYRTYQGMLQRIPGQVESPDKMEPDTYQLEFQIDTVTTLTSTLGVSL